MKSALFTALLRLGLEKGMSFNKARPKLMGLKLVAAGLLLIGALFLLVALHQWLSLYYGKLVANSTFGGAAIVLALAVLTVIKMRQKKIARQPPADPIADLQNMAQPLLDTAYETQQKARQTLYQHQGKVIIGVLLIGALLGRYQAYKFKSPDRD